MNILDAYIANMKRLIKSPKVWVMFIIMPAFMFLLFFFMFNSDRSGVGNFGLVVEDRGDKYQSIVEAFPHEPLEMTREEAEIAVKNYDVKLVYLIEEDFSEKIENNIKPEITKIFVDDSGFQIEDKFINDKIVEMMEENYLSSKAIELNMEPKNIDIEVINMKSDFDMTFSMVILTSSYIIILLISTVGNDIMEIIRKKLLSRILTTPNTNFSNIFALFLSYLTIMSISYNAVTLFGYKLLDVDVPNILYVLVIISIVSGFALALVLLVLRYSKNETVLSIVTSLGGILLFLWEMFYLINKSTMPPIMDKLIYINPLFWVQETMENGSLLYSIPIVLMTLVMLTFGSYKLEKLQKI